MMAWYILKNTKNFISFSQEKSKLAEHGLRNYTISAKNICFHKFSNNINEKFTGRVYVYVYDRDRFNYTPQPRKKIFAILNRIFRNILEMQYIKLRYPQMAK